MPRPVRFGAIVPAAGLGRRAGGPKVDLVLSDDPRPLLERCVAGLQALGADPIALVVRPPFAHRSRSAGAKAVVPNPAPEAMIDSVLAALDLIETYQDLDGLLLCPIDAPRAIEAAARWLPAALQNGADGPLVPQHRGLPGHPVWLPRAHWPSLRSARCQAEGARAALRGAQAIAVDDPRILHNANHPEPGAVSGP